MSTPEIDKIPFKSRHGLVFDQIRRKNTNKTVPNGPRGISVTDKGTIWDEKTENSSATLDDASTPEPERVRVTIRVRPATAAELEANAESIMETEPSKNMIILHREEATEFLFDAVMSPSASQADIYNVAARPIVYDVLNGYNGTVMAYGQTGAGKTYTLSSTIPQHHGIIPLATAEIFMVARLDNDHEYRVSMSYIQIYMEMIQDLLRPSSLNMQIRESENGVYVSGVEEVEVKSVEDCLKLLALGERNRAFAFTKLNAHSSRSHAIAVITVQKKSKINNNSNIDNNNNDNINLAHDENVDNDNLEVGLDSNNEKNENSSQISDDNISLKVVKERILVGKLFLVDLAGSERLKKSGSEGMRASEAKSINLSLTCLGKCINARADPNSTHVPFRDSKLTRLLQESLGGNAKTSLVINVAPSAAHTSESLSSLHFGSRAMKVKTKAVINEEEEFRLLSRNMPDSSEINQDERVQSLEVVVYSQEEQLAQAKSKLDRQLQETSKIQMEKVNLIKKQEKIMEERDMFWEAQLRVAELAAENALEEVKQRYRENLAETVEGMNSQRARLAETLKKSRARATRLENQVKLLQRLLSKNSDERGEDKSEYDYLEMAELEDAIQSEKEEQAARLIQQRFRQYRLDKILSILVSSQMEVERSEEQIQKLQFENSKLEELASVAGHKMVSASMHNVTSLIACLNKRFLTPKSMF